MRALFSTRGCRGGLGPSYRLAPTTSQSVNSQERGTCVFQVRLVLFEGSLKENRK